MQRIDNILNYLNYKIIKCEKWNQPFYTLLKYYNHIINVCKKKEIIKCSTCNKYRLKKDICNYRLNIYWYLI